MAEQELADAVAVDVAPAASGAKPDRLRGGTGIQRLEPLLAHPENDVALPHVMKEQLLMAVMIEVAGEH